MLNLNLIRVHCTIALANASVSSLYYYLRLRDSKNQGWIRLSLKHLSQFFGISIKRVKERAKKAVKLGFLQAYEVKGDCFYAKYTGITHLKKEYGPVHASAEVDANTLSSLSEYKQFVYKVAVFAQQETCEKAIEHSCSSSKNIYRPTELSRSHIAKAADWVSKDDKRVFLPKRMRAVGASQITVAAKLGVSRITVNKYCQSIPHIRVLVRRKLRENPPACYYSNYKYGKDGRKVNRQYREQPCYYIQDMYVRREKSSQVTLPTYEDLQDSKEAALTYISRLKKKPCRTLSDYLSEIKRPKLEDLANEMTEHFKGVSNPKLVASLSRPDLEEAINNGAKTLDKEEQELVLLMAKRARKGKYPMPHSEILCKKYTEEYREIMAKSTYEQDMAEIREEIEKEEGFSEEETFTCYNYEDTD